MNLDLSDIRKHLALGILLPGIVKVPGLLSKDPKMSLKSLNLDGYSLHFVDNLHTVVFIKTLFAKWEEKWTKAQAAKVRENCNRLIGRDIEKLSLWSDRGGSLRDWRKLIAVIASDFENPLVQEMEFSKDRDALNVIAHLADFFKIIYSNDRVSFPIRCQRALSLIVKGFLIGKICVEKLFSLSLCLSSIIQSQWDIKLGTIS